MTAFEKRIIILNLLSKSAKLVFRSEIEDLICLGQTATLAILKELRECGFVGGVEVSMSKLVIGFIGIL